MKWHEMTAQPHERTFAHDGRLSSLPSEWERELAALWRVEVDVNNGAYLQFLANWGRECYAYASQALKKIGALKMAEIIDRCQALVDEHFSCEGKSPDELQVLLPGEVITCDGNPGKDPGSVLPEAIVARICDLSYEFMGYPDDVAQLGLKYYWSHFPEIKQWAKDAQVKREDARKKQESDLAALEADLRGAERTHQERVKQGKACPKCGFSYAWNGAACGHCNHQALRLD